MCEQMMYGPVECFWNPLAGAAEGVEGDSKRVDKHEGAAGEAGKSAVLTYRLHSPTAAHCQHVRPQPLSDVHANNTPLRPLSCCTLLLLVRLQVVDEFVV